MKNIQINKKWLSIIALLFLVISLSSCSATSYWWGESMSYQYDEWEQQDYDNPLSSWMWSILTSIGCLFDSNIKCNFFTFITGLLWCIAIPSLFFYIAGRADDVYGTKYYDIEVDGKKHSVTDHSEEYVAYGTGSVERGHSWSDRVIGFIFSIYLYYLTYSWITGWFDDLNMLFKVIIGGVIIVVLFRLWGLLIYLANITKYISWIFCPIDFILGVLVTLWIN